MFTIGRLQQLFVRRFTPQGAYLTDKPDYSEEDTPEEVLLPNRYLTETMEAGMEVEVFIYHDSEDRIVATTDRPYVQAGEAALLEAVDRSSYGIFLDWGLPKDLFLPFSNQTYRPAVGDWCMVYVYPDPVTGRLVASMKLNRFVSNADLSDVRRGDEVTVVPAERAVAGFRCVVDNRHWGMLYDNQLFRDVRIGDILKGYVVRITEENRMDLSLQPTGLKQLDESAAVLLRLLDKHDGVLPLGDKSSPEEIREWTQMSKKMFKRGAGVLLKEGKIRIGDGRIERT